MIQDLIKFSKNVFKQVKWKWIKDYFTLIKNWTEVFKSVIVYY